MRRAAIPLPRSRPPAHARPRQRLHVASWDCPVSPWISLSPWRSRRRRRHRPSIAVMIGLERPLDRNADVGGLLIRKLGELDADLVEVQPGDFLVETFW